MELDKRPTNAIRDPLKISLARPDPSSVLVLLISTVTFEKELLNLRPEHPNSFRVGLMMAKTFSLHPLSIIKRLLP